MFERQGIIGSRQGGEHHDDDGTRLELISAGTEGLMPIRERAMAAEQAAKLNHQEAATAHASALDLLARHEDEAVETALVQHAESLGRFLFETLGKLETIGRCLDRRQPAWGPSAKLYYSPRKIQAARGKL